MKKNIGRIVILLSVFVLVLSACKAAPAPAPTVVPESITLVDALGNEIVLEEPAQRIVSLSPSTTEILFAIGAGDRVVGRDSNSLFPADALEVLDLGGMWDGVPAEDILALEPDLVVAAAIISPDNVQQLIDLGLTVYSQPNPVDFASLFDNIRQIAVMTGNSESTEVVIEDLQSRIDGVTEVVAAVEEIPLVFYELDATDPTNPWTTGSGTFISYVINEAKGENLGDVLEGGWAQISSEELVAQDPDVIFLADAMYGVTVESLAERAGWGELTAVVNGAIYPIDPSILSVPGPRLVDGFEEVTKTLHPDLFE